MFHFFDTHCHLADLEESDLKLLIPDLSENYFLSVCKTIDDWHPTLALSNKYPKILPALGIHPWFVHEDSFSDSLTFIESEAKKRVITAMGEIGLDYGDKFIATKALQMKFFDAQLAVAKNNNGLPISIHCVKAFDDVFSALKLYGIDSAIMHGFSGSREQAKKFVSKGIKIGIGAQVLNEKSSKYQKLVGFLPLESLVLETDMPYSKLGSDLSFCDRWMSIVKRVAFIKSETIENVVQTTYETARSILGKNDV